ncbi:hypothetical protein JOB18_048678 [Solea senegalensis]|uniref:Endonuclease/exonuclease/phosphatase domain-containing protein n=1 Tax=Solea senegalensis TaxID=28829 RepID=A0AAV6QY85_SOLSE|nr:hypothetical protein JOB18_048678 [Solea senegalensis]
MVSTFVGTDDPWLLAVLGFRSGSAHNYMSIFLGANVQDTQRMLTDQILCVEQANPDSLVIVLGDFNKGNLTHKLPKYRQFIKSPTREENILDHCYTTVRDAYHAPHAALGHSDHVMVHLITAYRQYLKLCKPGVRTSKKWTSEAVEEPLACFDSTDWDVFRTATNSLDESTEAVTSYISFWLRQITNYKPRAPHSINDQRLANDLNEFYCHFERQRDSPATIPHDTSQQPQLQCITSISPTSAGAGAPKREVQVS